jgi:hypothetical protein
VPFGFLGRCFDSNHPVFRAFSKLKSLEIPPLLYTLGTMGGRRKPESFFADMLPSSLRLLSISYTTHPGGTRIRGLSEEQFRGLGHAIDQGKFPSLGEIHVLPWREPTIGDLAWHRDDLGQKIIESWRTRRPRCVIVISRTQEQKRLDPYL